MTECIESYYVTEDEVRPSSDFNENEIYRGDSIYEVMRVIEGVAVFREDHLERMVQSGLATGKECWLSTEEMNARIHQLIEVNRCRFGNIKVVFNHPPEGEQGRFYAYFTPHYYPDEVQYREGVKTILFHAERENPTAKVIHKNLRIEVYKAIIECGAYEALLVNREGFITEGSRSNVFGIVNDHLVTAPDPFVLRGISRKYVLMLCRENRIDVDFSLIPAVSLDRFDALFLTGTSPKVLPVCDAGDHTLDPSHPLLKKIRSLYEDLISQYIFRPGTNK